MSEILKEISWHWSRLKTWPYLRGLRFMRPTLKNQKLWLKALDRQSLSNDDEVWSLLTRYQLPLLRQHASSAHTNGIKTLSLDQATPPSFDSFVAEVFEHTGWRLVEALEEIAPALFFNLLRQRMFPVVKNLRPLSEVWCGSKPDFWHEAVGHIACLSDQTFSEFYQWCGEQVTRAYAINAGKAQILTQLMWVVLEYGFIQERGDLKSFGAALTGSYMGLKRFELKHLELKLFNINEVLSSKLFDEEAKLPRSRTGKIVLFYARTLDDYKNTISAWLGSSG